MLNSSFSEEIVPDIQPESPVALLDNLLAFLELRDLHMVWLLNLM